jgi:hypothetical protein
LVMPVDDSIIQLHKISDLLIETRTFPGFASSPSNILCANIKTRPIPYIEKTNLVGIILIRQSLMRQDFPVFLFNAYLFPSKFIFDLTSLTQQSRVIASRSKFDVENI